MPTQLFNQVSGYNKSILRCAIWKEKCTPFAKSENCHKIWEEKEIRNRERENLKQDRKKGYL